MKKEKPTENVTVRLTKKQLSSLDRLAIELYSDRSKLIRMAVDILIAKRGKRE